MVPDQTPLISIIVPVYNGDAHLRACLDSALSQTLSSWELILVDDGSTDGTAAIADAYAQADSRISVYHRENGGVGAARNAGLDAANGELIAFLDADDILPTRSLEARLALLGDADMALARYGEFVSPRGEENAEPLPETAEAGTVISEMPFTQASSWDRRSAVLGIACSGELRYQGFLFNKLFRASIIEHEQLRFDTDLSYNEDRLFCTAYALGCTQVKLGNDLVYWYRRTDTSAMGALANMTDEHASKVLSEFTAYERIMALVESDYPEIATFVAADAMYRAVALRESTAPEAVSLRNALGREIERFGTRALDAENNLLPASQRAKIRAHVLLKR